MTPPYRFTTHWMHRPLTTRALPIVLVLGAALACTGGVPTEKPEPAKPAKPAPEVKSKQEAGAYGLLYVDFACAVCLRPDNLFKNVFATSHLDNSPKYDASHLVDQNKDTAWCDGVDGPGIGQVLDFQFSETRTFGPLFLHGGYLKSEKTLRENARVKTLRLTVGPHSQLIQFPDPAVAGDPNDAARKGWDGTWFGAVKSADGAAFGDFGKSEELRTQVDRFQLEIVDVYPGAKYQDLCISELTAYIIDD